MKEFKALCTLVAITGTIEYFNQVCVKKYPDGLFAWFFIIFGTMFKEKKCDVYKSTFSRLGTEEHKLYWQP